MPNIAHPGIGKYPDASRRGELADRVKPIVVNSGKCECVRPPGMRSRIARHSGGDTQEAGTDERGKILARPLAGCGTTLGNAVISVLSPVRRRNPALKTKALRDSSPPAAPRSDRPDEFSRSLIGLTSLRTAGAAPQLGCHFGVLINGGG